MAEATLGHPPAPAMRQRRIDPARFIRENLRVLPVPFVREISLYTAHPASGLWQLADFDRKAEPVPPYWAYQWAGGLALARYILDHPQMVAGRRVLDLGTGSGLVAIAAAKAGAARVFAADIDPHAIVAAGLNAVKNAVHLEMVCDDLLDGPPPLVDIIVIGDLYYDEPTALRLTAYLDRCLEAGIAVLIGDPYRAHLPHSRLRLVAEYAVSDFGQSGRGRTKMSGVFAFEPAYACP